MRNQWLFLGAQALRHSRKLKIALIAGGTLLVLFLGLAVWGGIALLGWMGGQVPAAWEAVKGQAPAVTQKIEEVAPGAAQTVGQWLPGKAAPTEDVAGEDLAGIPRFEGFKRVRYAVDGDTRSVAYAGRAPLRAVADHYAMRFREKGWTHRILFAEAREERHEYLSPTARFELHVVESGGTVTVTLRETPLAGGGKPPSPAAKP